MNSNSDSGLNFPPAEDEEITDRDKKLAAIEKTPDEHKKAAAKAIARTSYFALHSS